MSSSRGKRTDSSASQLCFTVPQTRPLHPAPPRTAPVHLTVCTTIPLMGIIRKSCPPLILRKLALVPSELELLRSHPKDERGEFEGGWAGEPVWANPHFCELSPKVRWFLISCSDAPLSAPSGDPRGESFWSHFGDILESILETFWTPCWNGKLTCLAPKGSSPTPAH